MLRAALIFICLFGSSNGFAQSVVGPDRPVTYLVRELVQNLIIPTVTLRPTNEKNKLRATEIRIVPGGPFPGPQAGIENGTRLIVLPELFVLFLQEHVEASIYAAVSDQPNFAEWWLDYTLWRSPVFGNASDGPFYRGAAPKRPMLFGGATIDQADEFVSRYETLIIGSFNAALIDILLHELGHHAIDQWYVPGDTPASQARSIENSADIWATEAYEDLADAYPGAGLIDNRNVAGRLFAIEYVFGLARWRASAQVTSGASHPEHVNRVSSVSSASDCDANSNLAFFCEFVGERLQRMSTQAELETDYRRRAGQGESFASYRLGMILLGRGDRIGGCELMEKAGNRRAQHYVGWCFEFGYIGTDLPTDAAKEIAVLAYQVAAEAGWADSIWGLKRLGVIP